MKPTAFKQLKPSVRFAMACKQCLVAMGSVRVPLRGTRRLPLKGTIRIPLKGTRRAPLKGTRRAL